MGIYLIFGIFMLASWLVSSRLKSKFKEYSNEFLPSGLTGKDIAEKMLKQNGIDDVVVISTDGELTDHYNPLKKTVNLSEAVYYGANVSAATVAAHECGHAIQHSKSYAFLTLRSQLVPVVEFSSRWMQWVLLAGILMINTFPTLLLIGIILFATTTLFSFITLPVEFDASRRALVWLDNSGVVNSIGHSKAQDALKWAALTYVVAALGSLASLLYYIMIYLGGDRR
ncbi:MAG: hypothetical protein A2X12_00910 [Bacteroidetes bacterium GWE2_29_8]|nr:MAG: hypothetical protein A2X12_00910 [Bacteroidetes bacterium GWE2_29_8]OFY15637.1 MAG: hypothetical protein A2X02_06380 [Bacteroidetes bacterium GWF2_29_10]